MRYIFKGVAILSFMGVLFALLIIVPRLFDVYQKGFLWKEMDWNNDGQTTIAEVIAGADVIKITDNREAGTVKYTYYDEAIKLTNNGKVVKIESNSLEGVAYHAFQTDVVFFYTLLNWVVIVLTPIMLFSLYKAYWKLGENP